mgnify:FL=1
MPQRFAARHTLEASRAVARIAGAINIVHARQNPTAIDAGAFHNDVVMVGSHDRILIHARALVDQQQVLEQLTALTGPLRIAVIDEHELTLEQAVRSYLFNSQLLRTTDGVVLVAPADSAEGPARAVINRLQSEGFINRSVFINLRESMMGGGGPACLRLRVPLNERELSAISPGLVLTPDRLRQLEGWVDQHYRRELTLADLGDGRLLDEGRAALDELTRLIGLGSMYQFQGGTV